MKKLYYTIGEVSELTGAEQHMLRYWETKIRQFKPRKNKGGNRVYTESDIEIAAKLKVLIVDKGYSVSGAQKEISASPKAKPEIPTNDKLKKDLMEIKHLLTDLKNQL